MKNKLKRILGVITAISLLLQMSFVITSNAAEYFSLDFESATDTMGWTSANAPGDMSIATDEDNSINKYFKFANTNGSGTRNAYYTFDSDAQTTENGLEVFANHGVFKEENVLGQKFIVNADLVCDTRSAGKEDNLEKSVNYAEVCNLITKVMRNNTFKLIEAAAENIAEKILLEYDLIREVTITLKKPWAPIMMSVDTVEVSITRKWHRAYIALGSNMGDSKGHLDGAVKELDADKYCRVKKVSEFIVTEPVGGVEQDDFLNGCLELETLYTPYELLVFLHKIEQAHNRERIVHWGPRTLDLDIILYDDVVMYEDDLIIPHIEMENREFVLKPLCEIAPYIKNPVNGKSIKQLLSEIQK